MILYVTLLISNHFTVNTHRGLNSEHFKYIDHKSHSTSTAYSSDKQWACSEGMISQ